MSPPADGGPQDVRPAEVSGENPFLALRHELNLSQADFARALGISLPALWAAEKGTTRHPLALCNALERLGYDTAELAQQFARWRAAQLEAGRVRLMHGLESDPDQNAPPAASLAAGGEPTESDSVI